MRVCGSVGACVFGIGLWACATAASAFDDAKYPDWKGQWTRARVPGAVGQPSHDPTKPPGRGQQAPLTAEYQAIFEANLADQAAGGQGNDRDLHLHAARHAAHDDCATADGIRRHAGHDLHPDRAHRAHAAASSPTAATGRRRSSRAGSGYSIGHWVDEDGDGRYDVLEVETRGFKGRAPSMPAACRCTPTTSRVFKERIYLDKADPNILHDEITVIDHALTRPWTVMKNYRRNPDPKAEWRE